MKTTPKALKGLYTALGGSSPIADESKTVDVLNAISTKIGGDGGAARVPDAIDNIAAKADDLVIPTGTITITENGENIDVAQYEKATVNVSGGGSSDFSTAEVTLLSESVNVPIYMPYVIDDGENNFIVTDGYTSPDEYIAPLYKGKLIVAVDLVNGQGDYSFTGDIVFDEEEGVIVITGDGTITYTEEG